MTDTERQYATQCALTDPHSFYKWTRWEEVRADVLRLDHYECQRCKLKYHRYRRATTVHHVNHLKTRPDLALDIYYHNPATHCDERNLLSLCHDCHEEVHGWRIPACQDPLTEERWD